MNNFRNLLASIALAMLLLACASSTRLYEGDPLPKDQVGVIVGMNPMSPANPGTSARLLSVDGTAVPGDGYKVELLPGTYELRFSVDGREALANMPIEAGHRYVIAKAFSGEEPGLIIDTTRQ